MSNRSFLYCFVLLMLAGLAASFPEAANAQEVVTLNRFEPATNGWVISSPQIRTDLVIVNERTKYASVRVLIGLSGGILTGYKYDGTVYSETNEGKVLGSMLGDVTQAPWGGDGRITVLADITYKGRKVASISEPLRLGGGNVDTWSQDVGPEHRTSDYAITNIAISSSKDETAERLIDEAQGQAAQSSLGQSAGSADQRGETGASQQEGSSSESDYWNQTDEQDSAERQNSGEQSRAASESTGLTQQQQQQFDGYVAEARRFEQAGSHTTAIAMYRRAHNISPESWISRKISSLQNESAAKQAEQEQQTEEAARTAATALRGTASALGDFGSRMDNDAFRHLSLYALGGFQHAGANGDERHDDNAFSDIGIAAEVGIEVDTWFRLAPDGILYNVGLNVGGDGRLFAPPTEDGVVPSAQEFGLTQTNYHYGLDVGLGGRFTLGIGARSYRATDGDGDEAGYFVEATEGTFSLSIGNFLRRGESWRVTYLTTTGMSLLGGGDGIVDEDSYTLTYWLDNNVVFWKAGVTFLDQNKRTSEYNFVYFNVGIGVAIR